MTTTAPTCVERDEWETPPALFAELDAEYQFTLDAAASHHNAKCARYYTREDDGLTQPWTGHTVWCNPPYGRQIPHWTHKAVTETTNTGTTIVMLLPASVDTRWFHDLVQPYAAVRFLPGRIYFHRNGRPVDRAPFPSMIATYQGTP